MARMTVAQLAEQQEQMASQLATIAQALTGAQPVAAQPVATQPQPVAQRLESATVRRMDSNVQTGESHPGAYEARIHCDKPGYLTFQPLNADGATRVTGEKSSRGPGHPTGYSRVRTSFIRAILAMDADDREALLAAADGDGIVSIATRD